MKNDSFLGIDNPEGLKALTESVSQINEIVAEQFRNSRYCFSGISPHDLESLLVEKFQSLPESEESLQCVIERIAKIYVEQSINIYSPFYMAHLHSTVSTGSVLGEYLVGLMNPSLDSWDQAPFATEIDEIITRVFLTQIFGKEHDADGVFTSGGSQSNLMGLLLARDVKRECQGIEPRKLSLGDFEAKFRIYCSSVSHFTIEKSAWLLGLGEDSVVKLEVDQNFKVDLQKFRDRLESDRANNFVPMCVVSTAGTTDYGSIDPIEEISKLASEYKMWHHVDAAYGGAMIFNSQACWTRHLALADSITIDMHKMLFQSILSSLFLFKKKTQAKVLDFESDYLNRKEDIEKGIRNLVDKSLQTSRRFDSLKLLITLHSMGRAKIEKTLQQLLDLASAVAEYLMSNSDIEVLNKPELSSIVFRYIPQDNQRVNSINREVRGILIQKGIIIGETKFQGDTFLKFTLLNPNAHFEDIKTVVDLILKTGKELEGSIRKKCVL